MDDGNTKPFFLADLNIISEPAVFVVQKNREISPIASAWMGELLFSYMVSFSLAMHIEVVGT